MITVVISSGAIKSLKNKHIIIIFKKISIYRKCKRFSWQLYNQSIAKIVKHKESLLFSER